MCFHDDFYALAHGWLRRIVSQVMGEEAVLLKEKYNYKRSGGGAGYAPHCDGPSCAAFSTSTRFVTAMIAVTPHTIDNGCLLICKGQWSEHMDAPPSACCVKCTEKDRLVAVNYPDKVMLTLPTAGGSKGGAGRVGALTPDFVAQLEKERRFESLPCPSGSVVLFDGKNFE